MPDNSGNFLAFGCGLPRTGTFSVSNALEQLLGGKCQHGYTMVFEKGSEHKDFWIRFSESEVKNLDDLQTFMLSHGYTAAIDVPITYHYKEMLEAFPKAKVLLTVRDPKSWYKSFKHFVGMFVKSRKNFPISLIAILDGTAAYNETVEKNLADLLAAGEEGEEAAIAYFNAWTEQIKREVPAERLLVYNVSEGWEPLCKFLNVPVPDCPFPHLNTTASVGELVHDSFSHVRKTLWALLFLFSVLFAYVLHGLSSCKHGEERYGLASVLLGLIFLLALLLYKVRVVVS